MIPELSAQLTDLLEETLMETLGDARGADSSIKKVKHLRDAIWLESTLAKRVPSEAPETHKPCQIKAFPDGLTPL